MDISIVTFMIGWVSTIACVIMYLLWRDMQRMNREQDTLTKQEKRHHEQLLAVKEAKDKDIRDTIMECELKILRNDHQHIAHAKHLMEALMDEGTHPVHIQVDLTDIDEVRALVDGSHPAIEGVPEEIHQEMIEHAHAQSMHLEFNMTDELREMMRSSARALKAYDLSTAVMKMTPMTKIHARFIFMHHTLYRMRSTYAQATEPARVVMRKEIDRIVSHIEQDLEEEL